MSQRRMFSLKVIDTDEFMDMPQTSQYLYYNLAMRADDDGFIANPKRIMRMVNCNDDDFKILAVKKFIIPFEKGICVIRHWRIHNFIRQDRYTTTEYQEEKEKLEIINGKYEQKLDVIPNDIPTVALGKVRLELGKVKLNKDNTPLPPEGEESANSFKCKKTCNECSLLQECFGLFWQTYPRHEKKADAEKSWRKIKPDKPLIDLIIQKIKFSAKSDKWKEDNGKYIPHPTTWLNGRRWEDEIKSNLTEEDKLWSMKK